MRKSLLMLAFTLLAGAAQATFHLWSMGELYSNEDGSVQFLELRALTGGQQFLTGHSLRSTPTGGAPQDFDFATGLPGDTTNKTMLIATQGYAALSGVPRPDYTVPNGFFGRNGGRLTFGEGADVWDYGPLPTAPLSLDRNGSTATNSPRNFAGQQGSVVLTATPAPGVNLQGLWWNSPDASESGWGLNIAHQGDILFTSWFTYDTDGSGMWLFQSAATKTGDNTYAGDIFRATGAPFSDYDVARVPVVPVKVGTGTLTFADAGHGTFAYTVNNVSQTKQIKRFDFASPVPACAPGSNHATNPNYTDLWKGEPPSRENGWGVNIVHQGNTLFISWFTYEAGGRGIWLYGVPTRSSSTGTTFTGALTRNTGPVFSSAPWNLSAVHATDVGTVTLAFSDASNGTFTYTFNGVTQTKTISRNIFSAPVTICQ